MYSFTCLTRDFDGYPLHVVAETNSDAAVTAAKLVGEGAEGTYIVEVVGPYVKPNLLLANAAPEELVAIHEHHRLRHSARVIKVTAEMTVTWTTKPYQGKV